MTAPTVHVATVTPMAKIIGIYTLGAAVDLGSCEIALSHGAPELNPFMQTRGRRLAMKTGQIALLTFLDRTLEKKVSKKAAKVLRIAALSLQIAVAARNVGKAR